MYRNQYDTDCITWSPQGRIFQIEYAMEGVKQGSCIVGVKSSTHVVLCAFKRTLSKLAMPNKKLLEIDDHVGATWSGITADANTVTDHMRMECLNHRFVYDAPLPVSRLVNEIADKSTVNTQKANRRPYCVGILVAGCDSKGSHLFETCPSGNFFEHYAMALGRRSQASKTYLEKHFESFPQLSLEELLKHAVKALNASVTNDSELTADNVAIGYVGKGIKWRELTATEIAPYLEGIQSAPGDSTTDAQGDAVMEGDATATPSPAV